jgi:catechol 2,3-dioxygenase-like lactoylglutathione lyase family enzyme
MKRIHIAISVQDVAASVADYSQRLGCKPCSMVDGEYALWRSDTVNFSIRQTGEVIGSLRHLGWEDPDAIAFSKDVDVNGIEWERFHAEDQANEINALWPQANYSPLHP